MFGIKTHFQNFNKKEFIENCDVTGRKFQLQRSRQACCQVTSTSGPTDDCSTLTTGL